MTKDEPLKAEFLLNVVEGSDLAGYLREAREMEDLRLTLKVGEKEFETECIVSGFKVEFKFPEGMCKMRLFLGK